MVKKKEDAKKSGGIQRAPSFKPAAKPKRKGVVKPKITSKKTRTSGSKIEYDRFLVFDIGLVPAPNKKYKPLIPVIFII